MRSCLQSGFFQVEIHGEKGDFKSWILVDELLGGDADIADDQLDFRPAAVDRRHHRTDPRQVQRVDAALVEVAEMNRKRERRRRWKERKRGGGRGRGVEGEDEGVEGRRGRGAEGEEERVEREEEGWRESGGQKFEFLDASPWPCPTSMRVCPSVGLSDRFAFFSNTRKLVFPFPRWPRGEGVEGDGGRGRGGGRI